ncbi:MAG: hypothetical protein PHF31_01690 [Methylobacter sp.]|nr:hypothetical protein [Methylobacter sp.]
MKNTVLTKLLKASAKTCMLSVIGLGSAFNTVAVRADQVNEHIQWVNHFDLLSGDTTNLTTTYNSTNSGVGSGLTGLVIQSNSLGDTFPAGGNKVVQMALELPKETKITGVRVCYENSSSLSFISQVRLAQVQNPPSSALVKLDDPTHLNASGPVCEDSTLVKPAIKSKNGPVLLSLRIDTGDIYDKIVIRGLGVIVK